MSRSRISENGFSPEKVQTLLAVYDRVWSELEPRVTSSGDVQVIQNEIASALITMAEVSQLAPERLYRYATYKARIAGL